MMDTTYIVAAGGLIGFVALALLMGAALASVADLLAILPVRGWWDSPKVRPRDRHTTSPEDR